MTGNGLFGVSIEDGKLNISIAVGLDQAEQQAARAFISKRLKKFSGRKIDAALQKDIENELSSSVDEIRS